MLHLIKKLLLAFILVSVFSVHSVVADPLKDNEIEQIILKIHKQTVQGGYQLMLVEDLKQRIDNKEDLVMCDAQPKEHYQRAFIEGAKNFEFLGTFTGNWKTDTHAGTQATFLALLGDNLEKTIVLSCGGLNCSRSNTAASWAVKLGYHHVYRIASGIKGWQAAGYPVKSID